MRAGWGRFPVPGRAGQTRDILLRSDDKKGMPGRGNSPAKALRWEQDWNSGN